MGLTQKPSRFLAILVLVANCVSIRPDVQGGSAGNQEQLLKVEVEKQTGNYVFRYKDPDGSPVEVVFIPATKIKPQMKPTMSFDRETMLVLYQYEIQNGESSQQELFNVKVKVIPPVENRRWPEGWYGFGPSPATNVVDWFQEKGATLVAGLVHRRGLPPGQSQSGFSFQSPNLPGVATVYFRGNTPDWPNPPRLSHEVGREMSKYTWWENDSVRKPTIGPAIQVSDLDPYDPVLHLQRLELHLAEQVPEEMLPNARLRADMKKYLGRAHQALQADHPGEASKQLKALRRRLSEAGTKDISTDLQKALLINLDYLEARLPQAK